MAPRHETGKPSLSQPLDHTLTKARPPRFNSAFQVNWHTRKLQRQSSPCSRNNKDFAVRYPAIASTLQKLPDETVIDGEVVALDDSGRPSFNTLQNFGSSTVPIFYYAFDVLILGGRDVRFEAPETRRELLRIKSAFKAAGTDTLFARSGCHCSRSHPVCS
jgi:ATP dependent DNA ligase-like protein